MFEQWSENHKECETVLDASERSNFSFSFSYTPWAFGSLDLRIGRPYARHYRLFYRPKIGRYAYQWIFSYRQMRRNHGSLCKGQISDLRVFEHIFHYILTSIVGEITKSWFLIKNNHEHIFSIRIFIRKFIFASIHAKIDTLGQLFRLLYEFFWRPLFPISRISDFSRKICFIVQFLA